MPSLASDSPYHCWRAPRLQGVGPAGDLRQGGIDIPLVEARARSGASARISMAGKRVRRRASVHCKGSLGGSVQGT